MNKVLSIVKDFIKNIALSLLFIIEFPFLFIWFIIKLPFLFIRFAIKYLILFIRFIIKLPFLFIKFIKVRENRKWLVWDFSGVRYIWTKIKPPLNEDEKLPTYRRPATFFLWLVGIYVALFGIASNRYENRADKIENRMNAIYAQISKDMKIAFSRIDDVQNMLCPYEPSIWNPFSIIISFLPIKNIRYEPAVEQLKQLVEDWAQKTKVIKGKEVGELYGFDLKGAHLENADLREAHLENADLREAHLENADLCWEAHLENADLCWEAHLENADLCWEAHLENANLLFAYLENADLGCAHLEKADLREAHLENADLREAHLENADLREAHLENADLCWEAHLENANLEGAHLENANLEGAHLENADLGCAHLEKADLLGSHLENALFRKANLKNAKNLTAEQLSKVFSLWNVKNLAPELKEKLKNINPKLFEPNYEVKKCNDRYKGLWWSDYLKKQKK